MGAAKHTWVYEGWHPEREAHREAVCATGNGYMVSRAAAEECRAGGDHYPGLYLAGQYDRATSELGHRSMTHEDLVNWPNWLPLSFRIDGGAWFDLGRLDVLDYRQELDFAAGVLTRSMTFRDGAGRETSLVSRRFVHMAEPHLAMLRWEFLPRNWSGRVTFRSGLDGGVTNSGVPKYSELQGRHLEVLGLGRSGDQGVFLTVRTLQSKIGMTQAARTLLWSGGRAVQGQRRPYQTPTFVAEDIDLDCAAGRPVRVEKAVAVYTSRDRAISEPARAAEREAGRAGTFAEMLPRHERAWAALWGRAGVGLEGAPESERVLGLHVYHLLQTYSEHTCDLDVGVTGRGLHGEGYHGHVFWDELFVLPFFLLRLPQVARSLLLYRYRRLPAARQAASAAGFRGAMFPWQSSATGEEESTPLQYNPRTGRWFPDHTHLQRHVGSAVAYSAWQYYQATGDADFLAQYGAELILSVAQFWASRAGWNPGKRRFEILGVMGPDEFHSGYPGAERPGVDNNAYTNVTAAWVLCRAADAVAALPAAQAEALLGKLGVTAGELGRWGNVSAKLFVPFHGDGVISQFAGYDQLREFDWEGYRDRYGDIRRLDHILDAEGDTPNRYQASKQPDVLMLLYLFSPGELSELLGHMGYTLRPDALPRTVEYYQARTSSGSTLTRVVQAWVAARLDRPHSWAKCQEALRVDAGDADAGPLREGLHFAAVGGSVDLVQRCYTGMELRSDVLWLSPRLPGELRGLSFPFVYRSQGVTLRVTRRAVTLSLGDRQEGTVRVAVNGAVHALRPGEEITVEVSGEEGAG